MLQCRLTLERLVDGVDTGNIEAKPLALRHVLPAGLNPLDPEYGHATGARAKIGEGRMIHDVTRQNRRMGR